MIQKNQFCGETIVEGEFRMLDVDWEPKCLVVVVAPDSRRILFEEMTVRLTEPRVALIDSHRAVDSRPVLQAAGRILTDPLNITLSYNVAMNPNPEIKRATINCHNSLVLQENHARDMVLQDELAELADARERSARFTELADWTENEIVKSQRFGLPYAAPLKDPKLSAVLIATRHRILAGLLPRRLPRLRRGR